MAGFLSRLFGRSVEVRSDSQVFNLIDGGNPFSGIYGAGPASPTPELAENLAAVTACVSAVSAGLASLPTRVYRDEGNGRIEAPNHPVARIIRQPNAHMTWPDWVEFTVAQMLLRGNSVSVVDYDGAGRPIALRPIPWETITVKVLPTGQLAYDVNTPAAPIRYLDTDVFHVRDRMDGPYVGRSRISRAPGTITGALGLQTYSGAVWENAATPSIAVTLPATITPGGKRRMDAELTDRNVGARNAKRVLYLDKDTSITPLSVSPEDAEVLASRRFSVIEICRLFNVPPPIVQAYENNTFTNAAQANLWFATNSLAPIARKIEAEFSRSLFAGSAYHIEVDLSGLLRGDYATRWTANVAAVTAGILLPDEVREQEGYGPLPVKAGE